MKRPRFGAARRALLLLITLLPVLFNPFASSPSEPIKVNVFRWGVLGILILVLVTRRGSPRAARMPLVPARETIELAVAIYATALVLATVFSIDASLSFWGGNNRHGLLTWLAFFVLFRIVVSAAQDPAWVRGLVDAVLVSTVPVCLYGLVQFAGLDPLDWVSDSVSEMTSTLGRSNYLGAYIAVVAPFALYRLWEARGEGGGGSSNFGPALALFVMHVSVVLLSQARAAWLGMMAGAAVFAGIERRRNRSWRRWSWAAVGWGAVLVFGLLTVVDLSSLRSSVSRDAMASFGAQRLQTLASRWMIWRESLALVPEHPVLGYGPETFATVFRTTENTLFVDDPHNILLDHLIATGALGLGAFCLLVVVLARQLRRCLHNSKRTDVTLLGAIGGSATAYLVQAQFNSDVVVLSLIFWLNLGLVAALSRSESSSSLSQGSPR